MTILGLDKQESPAVALKEEMKRNRNADSYDAFRTAQIAPYLPPLPMRHKWDCRTSGCDGVAPRGGYCVDCLEKIAVASVRSQDRATRRIAREKLRKALWVSEKFEDFFSMVGCMALIGLFVLATWSFWARCIETWWG